MKDSPLRFRLRFSSQEYQRMTYNTVWGRYTFVLGHVVSVKFFSWKFLITVAVSSLFVFLAKAKGSLYFMYSSSCCWLFLFTSFCYHEKIWAILKINYGPMPRLWNSMSNIIFSTKQFSDSRVLKGSYRIRLKMHVRITRKRKSKEHNSSDIWRCQTRSCCVNVTCWKWINTDDSPYTK